MKLKEEASGRAQRVVKHPLFRPFNAAQAEEFLGPQGLGDLVIRPSSKGLDHLTVTWKVSDNVFQHIDVLELDKENEFSVGRVLRIGGRYTYTDLDELINSHVQAMAKKVREIKNDERFQDGSKSGAGKSRPDCVPDNLATNTRFQRTGLPATWKRTPSAPCTPSASTANTLDTSISASSNRPRRRLLRGQSRSSPMHLRCKSTSIPTWVL